MGLLQHLKSHKRTSPPTDVESTYLLENSLETNPLADTRLPFHLLLQTTLYFWKIICEYYCEDDVCPPAVWMVLEELLRFDGTWKCLWVVWDTGCSCNLK